MEAERETLDHWLNGRATVTNEAKNDFGFTVGGPVVQDRAFFFGAVHPQWNTRAVRAPLGQGFALESLGSVDRTRRFISYAAKGTFQLGQDHRIDASFFGDPAESDPAPQREDAREILAGNTGQFSSVKFGSHQQTVKYLGVLNNNWLLEASWARAASTFDEVPPLDEWNTRDRRVTPNIRSGGIGFFENTESDNIQYRITSTHLVSTHQIRYGFSFEDIKYDALQNRTGPTIILPDGTPTATGAQVEIQSDPVFGTIWRVTRAGLTVGRQTTQEYLSFFVQDKFDIGDRVTISAGLRYEQQELIGNLAGFKWDNNFAPRLGVIFDPKGDGRSKIYANWGRFFAKIPNDLASRAMDADASATRADYFDAALTMPVPDGVTALGTETHFLIAGLAPSDFDPDSKSSFLDEFIAGYEFEALPELNLGVRFIFRDMKRVLEDIGNVSASLFFTLADPPSIEYIITNVDPSVPTFINQGAFEQPLREYTAIEVTADKRFAEKWAVFASYRWSKLFGNFEGFFRSDNGQSDPGITSLFDFPVNDPTFAAIAEAEGFRGDINFQGAAGNGRLPNDRNHQIKFYTTYAFDNGIGIGIVLFASTGRPLTALAAHPVYQNAGEIPEDVRGSGFETENGFRTRADFQTSIDIHVDYRFAVGDRANLILLADFFNLFNQQDVLRYREFTQLTVGVPDPDFGKALEYANPLTARFGVRFEF